MTRLVRIPLYGLMAGVFLAASGCVVAPDHYPDRAYDQGGDVYYQRDYSRRDYDRDRDHDRREAYERCRREGGRDCDDILHR